VVLPCFLLRPNGGPIPHLQTETPLLLDPHHPRRAPGLRRACRPLIERLETRNAPSGLQPSAAEQYLLERINDARANPAAFGAAHDIRLAGVAPRPPLAFDVRLVAVAHHFAAGGFGPVDVNAYKAAIRATGYHFFEPHSIAVNEAGLNGGIGTEQQVLDELLPPLLRVEAGRPPCWARRRSCPAAPPRRSCTARSALAWPT